MEPFVPLSANIVIALLLVLGAAAVRLLSRLVGRGAAALAVVPLLDAGLLLAYVFGEDTYRDHEVTRWDAYRSPGGVVALILVTPTIVGFSAN